MEGNQETRIQKFMGGNKKGYQTAFHMAWPAVMESFFYCLAGMVDSLMVSSMGPEAVAAVGLTTQPKFIGLCIFIATNVSVSALVARRRGEKDQYGANQVLLMAAAFTLAVGTDQHGLRFLCRSHYPALRGQRGYPGGSRPVFPDHHGRDDV